MHGYEQLCFLTTRNAYYGRDDIHALVIKFIDNVDDKGISLHIRVSIPLYVAILNQPYLPGW